MLFLFLVAVDLAVNSAAPETTRALLERVLNSIPNAIAAVTHRQRPLAPVPTGGFEEVVLPKPFKFAAGAFDELADSHCRFGPDR